MKSFFLLATLTLLAGSAHAGSSGEIQHCVGVMMGNPETTREKAEYACNNPFLEYREGDTAEHETMRQELARDAAEAKEEMLRNRDNPER